MILFPFFKIKKTYLNIIISLKVQQRFYPQQAIVTHIARGLTFPSIPLNNSLTRSNPIFMLSNSFRLQDNRCLTRKINYRRNVAEQKQSLGAILSNTLGFNNTYTRERDIVNKRDLPESVLSTKKEIEASIEGTFSLSTKVLLNNENLEIRLPEMTENNSAELLDIILNIIKGTYVISPDSLMQLLHNLHQTENLSEIQKNIYSSLRLYLKKNPPTIEQAQLFVQLWDKTSSEYVSLVFKIKENLVKKPVVLEKVKKTNHKDQKVDLSIQISHNKTNIDNIFKKNANNPLKILNSEEIKLYYDFLKNRGSVLPLQKEEFEIYNKLKILYEQNAPEKELLLNTRKDNLKVFKENSVLPAILIQDLNEPCFTLEDYKNKIAIIELSLGILQEDKYLEKNDVILLAINSFAATMDDEGTLKLVQDTYLTLREKAPVLGIKNCDTFPNIPFILKKIENKDYFILSEKPLSQRKGIVDVALESHKTFMVFDEISGKRVKVQLALLTSTKDGFTIKIDDYQQTNPDPEKQQKAQMLRIPSTFTVMDDQESVTVDLEATLFFRGKNFNGQDISKLLLDAFSKRSETWSNNPYQYPYTADETLVRKLSILSYQNQLQELQEIAQNLENELNTLSAQNRDAYDNKLLALENEKIIQIEKKDQQYFSLLPKPLQDLYQSLKFFEERIEKDNQRKAAKEHKDIVKALMEQKNLKDKEEQNQSTSPMTAKEKKEQYLKNKKSQND